MQIRPSKSGKCSILFICYLIMTPAQGLDTDKDEVIEYVSGDVKMQNNGNSRIIVLNENVKVTQGTLQISGDSATFEYDLSTNDLKNITVSGKPARYQQQLNDDGLVEGESETIHYYVNPETIVEFVGDANLRQPGTTTNRVAIKYFTETELFETTGPCSGVLSNQTN